MQDNSGKKSVQQYREDIENQSECIVPFNDDYLSTVLAYPQRSYDHALNKMIKCMKWRESYGVDKLLHTDVENELCSGSMYWYGYDNERRPIIWVRPILKNWGSMNKEQEIRAHVVLLEAGCRWFMPEGITQFTLIADSSGLGFRHMDLQLMNGLLEVCVNNYPDRVAKIYVGPMNPVLNVIANLLLPVISPRLRDKINMFTNTSKLLEVLQTEQVPNYFNGPAQHQMAKDSNQRFDFNFMIQQQVELLDQLESTKE